MAPQEFGEISLGEVYRRVVEDGNRNQEALADIRNNMVSKAENNALLAAQNQRISQIEQSLAQKQADASHEHAELEANSKARNQEMKTLLEKAQVDNKLAVKEQADRLSSLEEGNKNRRGQWLIAISLAGIGVVLSIFQNVISRGLGF